MNRGRSRLGTAEPMSEPLIDFSMAVSENA